MYFDYIKEREGKESIVTDYGFAIYSIQLVDFGKQIYVHDVYLKPEARGNKQFAGELMAKLYEKAYENCCQAAIATVDVTTNGADHALLFHLKQGMKMIKAEGNLIYTWKKL